MNRTGVQASLSDTALAANLPSHRPLIADIRFRRAIEMPPIAFTFLPKNIKIAWSE